MKLAYLFILALLIFRAESSESSQIQKIDSNAYMTMISKDQILMMQKLPNLDEYTYQNYSYSFLYHLWKGYGNIVSDQVEVDRSVQLKNSRDLANALEVFLKSLELVKTPKVDVWVVSSISPELLSKEGEITPQDVARYTEMSFAAITKAGVPIVQHFGIARNPLYAGVKHAKTAILLQSFAAAAMQKHDKEKLYMINIPLAFMRDMILNALPKDATAMGVNHKKSWIVIDKDGNFILKDYMRTKQIFKFQPKGKERDNAWFYLFATGSSFSPDNYFTVRLDKLADAFN